MSAEAPEPLRVVYTNWRGETQVRRIFPKAVRWGSTEWHPQPQWLMDAWDEDKQAWRTFALKDMRPTPQTEAAQPGLCECGHQKAWHNEGPCSRMKCDVRCYCPAYRPTSPTESGKP